MPQSGFTPVQTYSSSTPGNVPLAANLTNTTQGAELAINIADGKLFYKDSSGVVQVIGTKGGVGTSSTTQVLYNSSGLVVGSANMTFDGSTLTTLNSAYTGTLTGGTGVVNLGSGQFYKDASGNVGIGVTPSTWNTDYKALQIGNYSSFYGRVSSNETGIMNNMYRNGSAQYTYLNSAAAAWYYISGSSHNWTSSASGTAGNAVTTTQVLSVDRGLTLALQGASSNSGTGITFPATQSASSDANTLDDYEEGTWTPVVSMNSGTSSGGSGSGTYIKIGRQVTVTMYLNLGTVSVGGTINGFTGFPFNSQNTNQVAVGLARENANTGFGWEIRVNANDSSGLLRTTSSNSANVATGDTFVGTVTYFTS